MNTADTVMASLPLHTSMMNKEDSFSTSLPRHGSHGSKTTTFSATIPHYNRSMDNIAATSVKGLPPRGQYHPSTTFQLPSMKKSLPPRRAHQAQQSSRVLTSERKERYSDQYDHLEDDIDNPLILEGLSQEDDSLQLSKNVIHRNAAYESVVRKSLETGYNSPQFDIEVEQQDNDTSDLGNWSNQQTHGSGTNFFEMCSDDGSKNDLNQFGEQHRVRMASSHSFNDYENVKECYSSNTYSKRVITPQPEFTMSKMEDRRSSGSSTQEPKQQSSDESSVRNSKPDYENVREYTQHKHDDTAEWIPLAEVPTVIPQLDLELSTPATVPTIVVETEPNEVNEESSKVQSVEEPEQDTASLGKDLRKSVDLETLSDYEEMVSSFSSHYNQQTFPFMSSTEVEGAQAIMQQFENDDDKQEKSGTKTPVGDTQQSKQGPSDDTGKQQPTVRKRKKAKYFQYFLIFITLAIATAALVMSTLACFHQGKICYINDNVTGTVNASYTK